MAANGISTLTYKRQRQEAKLAAAKDKREADGRTSTLVKGRLPTLYTPSNNKGIKNNSNSKGLFAGRPWK